MDCIAMVCGGAATPYISSLLTSPTARDVRLSCAPTHLQAAHLAVFRPQSHLFACSSSSHYASKKSHKTRVFLPHLIASLEVEETYIMIKPDGVQRGLVGEIISRFERKGFQLTGLKLFQCPKELAQEHYKDLQTKPFFPKLIDYITSGPVVCMAWEGVGVVASAQNLIVVTNPLNAEPGTIRGDLAVQTESSLVQRRRTMRMVTGSRAVAEGIVFLLYQGFIYFRSSSTSHVVNFRGSFKEMWLVEWRTPINNEK